MGHESATARRGGSAARSSGIAGALALASLGAWWVALAGWAQGVSGYLGVPGAGTSGFVWMVLTSLTAVMVLVGMPSAIRSPRTRSVLLVGYVVLAAGLAIPNAIVGIADGISTPGLVVGAISMGQVALLAFGIRRAGDTRDQLSSAVTPTQSPTAG